MMQYENFLKVEITPPGDFTSPLPSPGLLSPNSPSLSAITPFSASTPTPTPGGSLSRRPSRKSTLTQQQKNQKRQRATQEQLLLLEAEFCRNPTPTAAVRERIADDIDMTERSVQIWFQNRRAKIKNLAKKSIETGEECEEIPESMRRYLAMQALESGRTFMNHTVMSGGVTPYGSGLLFDNESTASKVMIYHLACQSLNIGSWRRVGQSQLDLVVFYSPAKSMMTYYIQADGSGFRIEYPFSYIKNITLDDGDMTANAEGYASHRGSLIVELSRPPIFSMDQGSGGWFQCRDFTEHFQASQVLTHNLGGHPKVLAGQLAKLVSLDAFQNRHALIDTSPSHLSLPVDPIGYRPASQPNHLVHPRTALFPSRAFDIPPPPRGHKRQRSRSVPVAIDFSQFRPSKAPFIMHQHHHIHTHLPNSNSQIYAPTPQHAPPMVQLASAMGPLGPTLNIDTSAGYTMDIPPCPQSASTMGTSPPSSSEYEGSFLAAGTASDSFSVQHMNAFTNPFLSPVPETTNMQHPSAHLPMSTQCHPDPMMELELPETPIMRRTSSRVSRSSFHTAEELKLDMSTVANNHNFTTNSSNHFILKPVAALEITPVEIATAVEMPPPQLPSAHASPVEVLPPHVSSTHATPPHISPIQTTPAHISPIHATPVHITPMYNTVTPPQAAPLLMTPATHTSQQPTPALELTPTRSLPNNLTGPLTLTTDFPNHKWLNESFVDAVSKKSFMPDQDMDSLVLSDSLFYDSYLTDPLALSDPFFDALTGQDGFMQHPLHDPILDSLHRHSRSKPSISTLAFREMPMHQQQHLQIGPAPVPTPPVSSPTEEFDFGHMVHCSEDFGARHGTHLM